MRAFLVILVCFCPVQLVAQDVDFRLAIPVELENTGFMQHLLPRFTLKHGVRITKVSQDQEAAARFGSEGSAVFSGLGQTWALSHDGSDGPVKFADWLQSEVGRNTIAAFQSDGSAIFTADIAPTIVVADLNFDGDPVLGKVLSFSHCGRCHKINETNRMNDMGATPSFGMLRTLENWQDRFATFYVRNPHPSFTQVAEITLPFDAKRPPPIVPLEITEDELEAIIAYVATIPLADLGAPIQYQ